MEKFETTFPRSQFDHNKTAVIPTGAAYYEVVSSEEVRDFTFALLPEFTFLAFASAIDPLRIANQLSQRALYRWTILSEDGRLVKSSSGISVNVDGGLGDIPVESNLFVCSGTVSTANANVKTLSLLRQHSRFGGLVGGICTGAITLAKAGLLHDRKATLHWENQPAFKEMFPDIEISSNLFEVDRNIVTCGGGTASTDLMLHFIEEDLGYHFANTVADMCLREARRPRHIQQRSSISNQIGVRNSRLARAISEMKAHLDEPISIEEISERAEGSRRQIERLFKRYLNTSPARYYRDLRLDHSRSLLRETDLTVIEIAMASGFFSLGSYRKSFRNRFGESPNKYRNK